MYRKDCFLISQSGRWILQTRKTTTHPWNWHDASHVIKSQSALESPKVHFLWIKMDPNLPDQWSASPNWKEKKRKKENSHLTSPSGGGGISLNMTSLKILTVVTLWASLVRDYNFKSNISKRGLIRGSIILSINLNTLSPEKSRSKVPFRVYYQGYLFTSWP